jgi:alpha-ketoglutarate-dependent taurine dioxygenase
MHLSSSSSFGSSFSSSSALSHDAISVMIRSLPSRLLRDDDLNTFDETTYQRSNVVYQYDTGKPLIREAIKRKKNDKALSIVNWHNSNANETILIEWDDGVVTKHDLVTLQRYYNQRRVTPKQRQEREVFEATEGCDRIMWTGLTEDIVRQSPHLSMTYNALIYGTNESTNDNQSGEGMKQALKALYRYGILLVTHTPTDNPASIAALGAALSGGTVKSSPDNSILAHYRENSRGRDNVTDNPIIVLPDATDGPLRTLYASVWSTSSSGQPDGTSVADSAYGNDGLPLHTDMTYLNDPPGLQIFTMVQPALQGGESVFGDGFAVAEELRRINPDAFQTLSTTSRRYHSRDDVTGWYLQASGPIIQTRSETDGRILSIRHNDLDRLPDIPPSYLRAQDDIDGFYDALDRAHQAWDELLSQDRFRLVMKLQPGDTMIVANQRCFHGRCSFQSNASTPRSVIGCYVAQDDLSSRMRMEGYDV